MSDKLTNEQAQAILKALNESIDNGPWDKSNFLRVIGKNLKTIRDDYLNQLNGQQILEKKAEDLATASKIIKEGEQEIYVSLYCIDGTSLQAWERIILNLPRQMISRPIYGDEQSVVNLIKSKENKLNEAYVVITVNQSDILQLVEDKIPYDKFGKALLVLKDRSLNLDKINRFVHNGISYNYQKGRLVNSHSS